MKKYVIEIEKSCEEPTDADLMRLRERFGEFIQSDRSLCVLPPGVTVKIFDTEDGVVPDVEVVVNTEVLK